MRKKSLTLSLAVILETAILASCTPHLTIADGSLAQIGPDHYKVIDIYNGQLSGAKAGKTYYDMLDNVYTQLAVADSDQIKAEVDNKLEKDFYEAARTNARNNGTSEKEEREKILNASNVDTVEEYRAKLTLDAKKTQASDRFYSDPNLNTGTSNDNVSLTGQYIEEDAPYHVKHILVKVTAATGELHQGKITDKEAKNISAVVERLATKAEKFGVIAQQKSEDEGSRENGGDLGIMDKNTSFVPEFKLGTYAWDMFYNKQITDPSKTAVVAPGADANLNLAAYSPTDATVMPADNEYVLGAIPLSAAFAMDYYAKTTDAQGGKVQNATEVNYPRNVLFNSYFNSHAVSLIYVDANDQAGAASVLSNSYGITDAADMATSIGSAFNSNGTTTVGSLGLSNKLFNYDYNYAPAGSSVNNKPKPTKVADDRPILTDDAGNPILVVRAGNNTASQADSGSSYEGVHFITVAKDPFVGDLESLKTYYHLDVRKSMEDAGTNIDFVNYIGANKDIAKYNERANKIREAVKSTDKNMEYKLYASNKQAVADKGITVEVPQIIADTAQTYEEITRNNNSQNDLETFNGAWMNYMGTLIGQRETLSASIPLNSISDFVNGVIPRYYLYDGSKWISKNDMGEGWKRYKDGAGPVANDYILNPAWALGGN